MVPPFDIFRAGADGSVVWLESAADLEDALARVKILAASSPGEYLIHSPRTGRQISLKLAPKRVIFYIGYEERQLQATVNLLQRLGYQVLWAYDNPAAKLQLMSPRPIDLFIVGHSAPEQTRIEILTWLKANYPKVKILALQPSNSEAPLQDADFNAIVNGSDHWLSVVATAVG